MDFIIEIVFELFGCCLEETFDSKKVKVWTKTVLFILLTQSITALMVWGGQFIYFRMKMVQGMFLPHLQLLGVLVC